MQNRIKDILNRIFVDLKGAIVVGAVFFVYYQIIHSIYDAFCPFLVGTGIPCAGCGLTRASIYLLQGQVQRAAAINPSIFLIIAFAIYCGYFRYIKGSRIKGFNMGLILLVIGTLIIYGYRMYLYFPERAPYVYLSNNVLAGKVPGYSDWISQIADKIQIWRSKS